MFVGVGITHSLSFGKGRSARTEVQFLAINEAKVQNQTFFDWKLCKHCLDVIRILELLTIGISFVLRHSVDRGAPGDPAASLNKLQHLGFTP